MGGDALPVLPPLEGLAARRRLASRSPVGRPAVAWEADSRSASALRFKGLAAGTFLTPLVCAGLVAPGAGRVTLLRDWAIRGEDEEDPEDWFWLSERLRPVVSDALAGGDEPRGDGF
jgi:hypothetical protein